jgi:predicted metal-binding protein
MQNLINEHNLSDKVVIKGSFCLGHCTEPVSVKVDDGEVVSINENNIRCFFQTNIVRRYK